MRKLIKIIELLLEKFNKITGRYLIFSLLGKRKLLKFNFSDNVFQKRIFHEIFFDKIYFRKFSKGRNFEVHKKDTIIDIGANIGFFSVYAANLAKKGKVYSFEPIKSNFQKLFRHKEINRLRNLFLTNKGISDKSKKIKIYLNNEDCGSHTAYIKSEKFETIQCISLKRVFDKYNIEKCNFLKIDCEGEEYKILRALPKSYFRKIDKIALEYHPVPNEDIWKLADYLNEQGFFIGIYHWRKNFGMLYAYKKFL